MSPLLLIPASFAVTLGLQSEDKPYPGVTWRHYHTTSPTTQAWVVLVDLCTDHVHVDATYTPEDTQSTKSWATDRGVQAATNGDFYKTGPVRVYGDAVGSGVRWPKDQSGLDSDYSDEWYYEKYGWIAFGWDSVEFTHTEWIKENPDLYPTSQGWEPTKVAPTPPSGTLALVSGFPELVIEGTPYTCTDPEDSDCFPDRSDMRDRHPRTAMGLTEDRRTFLLAVVDGRTDESDGMYGTELASLMFQLGAWVAFNLDGGGSSQMWIEGEGYVNDYDGNNSGGGAREVANHWGVFAGSASGMAQRAGHCGAAEPCGILPPGGGLIDDQDACFGLYGSPEYWREEDEGNGDHLYWTNAWESDIPDNWAWWQVHLEQAGEYQVESLATEEWAVYKKTSYVVRAGGADHEVTLDQGASAGWQSLGTFTFDAGGDQWVAVHDNASSDPGDDQHIVADAIRLTRVGSWCGDGACDEGEDCFGCAEDCPAGDEIPGNGADDDCDGTVDEGVGDPEDTDPVVDSGPTWDSGDGTAPPGKVVKGCGCASTGVRGGWALGLALLLGARRRRGR